MEHFVVAAMQDDALKALISDVGEGIVIDPEILEGCSVAAHDLDDMDAVQAAEVAAHVFCTLFETKVSDQSGESAEPEEGEWSGSVNGFRFVIERDGDGDLVVDFSDVASSSPVDAWGRAPWRARVRLWQLEPQGRGMRIEKVEQVAAVIITAGLVLGNFVMFTPWRNDQDPRNRPAPSLPSQPDRSWSFCIDLGLDVAVGAEVCCCLSSAMIGDWDRQQTLALLQVHTHDDHDALWFDLTEIETLGDYTVAILATIGLVIVFTVPVVWQFLQPNDDDFGDISKKPRQ